ncbi:ribosomal protein L25/Gln-tRNA synthetase [Tribonema minus]|uniref:Ribosomal protein L25/Gln-tRNA synthetase n=1 Tax=Tribonema minus TaxID=303371 RepID=A0A836CCB4_9STRA|nr:ribosomal protein L25/Gln-tRNA synthetase [Tribonema minus]
MLRRDSAAAAPSPSPALRETKANTAYPRLRGAAPGRFATVFRAAPSSFLDLCQTKSLINCAYYSDQYEGRLIVRIDDSGDPSLLDAKFDAAILQDLKLLGVTPDAVTRTSDYFVRCEQMAERLIMTGRAYIDLIPDDVASIDGYVPSCRGRPPAESLHLFQLLCVGHPEGKRYCLRARSGLPGAGASEQPHGLGSCSPSVRRQHDPIIYQHGRDEPHYRQAYPTPVFAAPVVDAFEGVTHALLTTDDDDLFYTWVQRALGMLPVVASTFGKVELSESALTQHHMHELVARKAALGWDDPRLPTLRGLVRRGMSMAPLRAHLLSLGASRRATQVKWESLWSANRKFLEPLAPRYMAVRRDGCVCMTVARAPPGVTTLSVPMHPRNEALGTRTLHVGDCVLLDAQDAESIEEGEEVTLLRWTSVLVTCIQRECTRGATQSLSSEYLPIFKFLKRKRAVTWLANRPDLVPLKLVEFGPILTRAIGLEDSAMAAYNRQSVHCVDALGDPELRLLKANDLIQLERLGFFRVDTPYKGPHEPMVLFMVPDGKGKSKHCSSPTSSVL